MRSSSNDLLLRLNRAEQHWPRRLDHILAEWPADRLLFACGEALVAYDAHQEAAEVLGEALAAWICDVPGRLDISALSPARFGAMTDQALITAPERRDPRLWARLDAVAGRALERSEPEKGP